ncbi:MAG: hypothetical protein KIT84_33405 [Labilithrix sp.]|nr:hypothetical protein [Labilithrix sp.]MCW5815945.1 hypothetical protein [Labilithrix sp.]
MRRAWLLLFLTPLLAGASCHDLSGFTAGGGDAGAVEADGGAESGAVPPPIEVPDAGADAEAGTSTSALSIEPPQRSPSGTIDLTAEGSVDWREHHSDDGATNRCGSCLPAISEIRSSTGGYSDYSDDDRTFVWSNGAPIEAGSMRGGVYVTDVGSKLSLDVASAPEPRALVLHINTYFTGATITARLEGSDLEPVTTTLPTEQGAVKYMVRIRFASAAPGTLVVDYTLSEKTPSAPDFNIAFSAATLAPAP